MHNFSYKWYMKNGYPQGKGIKNNLKVFGTFINGGGSTMGYKLAGYTHLGGVEIDVQVANIYKKNHNPKYLFIEDIRDFNNRKDLPEELYNLDILDGSPPCSTFSIAGQREAGWGKKKKFREGQVKQTLDDLVFVYIETINKLRPKVAILENVKGIIIGNAKAYTKEIVKRLNNIGYIAQVFLLNSATMGVPQKRERVFFICSRKDLNYPKLKLNFNEKVIYTKEVLTDKKGKDLTPLEFRYWRQAKMGESIGKFASNKKYHPNKVPNTVASGTRYYHYKIPRLILDEEFKLISSYPQDYDFCNINPQYLIGMSVPPVMMAQISRQIYLQWFSL